MIDRSYIFTICMLTQIWIWTTGMWSVKCEVLCWVEQLLRAGLSGLHLSIKACKISRSQICKKVILFSQVLSSGTRIQRSAIRNVLVSMSFTIQSKQMSAVYKYSNYFFLRLLEEKGPVPLKVGLIVVEVGWCPCNVQSLYPLQCLFPRTRVCSSVRSRARSRMHVHIDGTLLTEPQIQKTLKNSWIY